MEYNGEEVPASFLKRVHVSHSETSSTGGPVQKQIKDYFKCRKVMGNDVQEDSPKNGHLYQVPKWNMLPCNIEPAYDVTPLTHVGVHGQFMNEQNQSRPSSSIQSFKDRHHGELNQGMLPHLHQNVSVSNMHVCTDFRNQDNFILDTFPHPGPNIADHTATKADIHGHFVPSDVLNHKNETDFLCLSESKQVSSNSMSKSNVVKAGDETCNDVSKRCVDVNRGNSERGIYVFVPKTPAPSVSENYISIEKTQCEELREITLPSKVAFVYNPLEYAFEPHYNFVEKFCNSRKKILFLGMNPGPWGMSQNGVPFGEGSMVRDWLKICGAVLKPCPEHPKRLVTGLNCTRSEVSGRRFWSFFRDLCGDPKTFFTNCFVYNMCPFAFMSETGKNITPPQIEARTLQRINTACDKALLEVLKLLGITTIVGVGKFAYDRARKVIGMNRIDGIRTECIMHPSPINPAANKGWSDIVRKQLQDLDLIDTIVNKE
ncbi:single-strand selective monofunctional uracil DNA glycosylase-like [Haliotis asinina]|uniref:single-strand selective monofunctional uracil DNA glycosylase-like n=1 Tax=Haliotis asinina TaxID=109174 RepID=UPI0035319FAD